VPHLALTIPLAMLVDVNFSSAQNGPGKGPGSMKDKHVKMWTAKETLQLKKKYINDQQLFIMVEK
jgi:hypothetical protein